MLFVTLKMYALDYTITFIGTGASTTIDSVIVQNLTKGTTVTVPTGYVLNLNDAPNAIEQLNANDETIRVYPNSVEGKSTVSFFAKQAGSTQINAYSIDGKKIAGITENLQTGVNSFQLSFPKGSFVIQVVGNGYTYTAKMINQTGTVRKPEIAYIGTIKPATSAPQKSKSSAFGITTMAYATGDQLLYNAVSGNYSTIVTDLPTASKTTNFSFVACADADGNNYKVVKIGTQTWMAENLKTTKYNDGTAIPLITDYSAWGSASSTPAYCWYNNDATTYKNMYGALYNWYAVNTAKLAPTGWHVPSDDEWITLENYLLTNGYNYDGTTLANRIAKSLAATTDWYSSTYTGSIGNNLTRNNTSGFTALPGNHRHDSGAFGSMGTDGYWWSSSEGNTTDAWYRNLYYINDNLDRYYWTKSEGYSVRCVRDLPASMITSAASMVSTNSATSGGNVTDDGGGNITSRGVCWSTSPSPTIALSTKTTETGTTGLFTSLISGLYANTTYYVRAYAINSSGIVLYGEDISFKTFSGTVNDIEGNIYNTVTIGTQVWMVENLKTTKYKDGIAIPLVTENTTWAALSTPAYCWNKNDATSYKETYGALYNWHTINTGKLAPTGWHIPTFDEWETLKYYVSTNLGKSGSEAKALAATTNWTTNTFVGSIGNDMSKNNSSGFSALPGGTRQEDGTFQNVGGVGIWWSSTLYFESNAAYFYLLYDNFYLFTYHYLQSRGYSVRCVRDLPASIAVVITSAASIITTNSATCGGYVTNDEGGSITSKGVCWSTSPSPTIALNTKTTETGTTGLFTSLITGLSANTTYYVRAYSINNSGKVLYGEDISFKTFTGTVTDIEGNIYNYCCPIKNIIIENRPVAV